MRFASVTLLALLCAGPAVAESGPLSVVVRGAPDAASVRARIASELGAPIVAIERCTGACLEIAITGSTANVAYTSADGVTRARRLELGADKVQWPIVIALLAGNLARDEAADVLAQLPSPRAPAPEPPVDQGFGTSSGDRPVLHPEEAPEAPPSEVVIPPAIAPRAPVASPAPSPMDVLYEQRREELPIAIGLVPVLSTDGLRIGRVRHLIAFHGIAGISGGSELLALSGIADVQNGLVNGLQIGGIVATAKELRGVQVGGILAVTERGGGVQLGGIGVLTRGRAHAQVAGIVAVAGSAELQLGGIAAISRGESNVQIGGIATSAGTANVQIAGIANFADRVRGVQIGTVNIARRVEGLQLGVVNIGGNAGGNSFGLINIVPGGRTDLEASVDSDKIGMVLFRHGGHNWHNVYGVAGQQIDEGERSTDDVWMYGLGFGPSWRQGLAGRIDLELMGWQVNHGANHSTDVSILGQLRATYAHQLGDNLSLIVGGAINAYISNDQMSPFSLARRTDGGTTEPDVTITVWPSAFVGVRL